jgi:hypothetical protein
MSRSIPGYIDVNDTKTKMDQLEEQIAILQIQIYTSTKKQDSVQAMKHILQGLQNDLKQFELALNIEDISTSSSCSSSSSYIDMQNNLRRLEAGSTSSLSTCNLTTKPALLSTIIIGRPIDGGLHFVNGGRRR